MDYHRGTQLTHRAVGDIFEDAPQTMAGSILKFAGDRNRLGAEHDHSFIKDAQQPCASIPGRLDIQNDGGRGKDDSMVVKKRVVFESTVFCHSPSDPYPIKNHPFESYPPASLYTSVCEVRDMPIRGGNIACGSSYFDGSSHGKPSQHIFESRKFATRDSLGIPIGDNLENAIIPSSTIAFPASMQLPTEVLHQIYYSLNMACFNSARHTCRVWFIGSLDQSLLETMLRRGGFSGSIFHDLSTNHLFRTQTKVNNEWLLSRRISLECALGPAWTGNGLEADAYGNWKHSSFMEIAAANFAQVAVHGSSPPTTETVFTVSTCGGFLMVANGSIVYIYELNRLSNATNGEYSLSPGSLCPVVSIICPSRVVACSMDTSCSRFSIAILLDGRMALVCDINALDRRPPHHHAQKHTATYQQPSPISEPKGHRRVSFMNHAHTASASNRASSRPSDYPSIAFPGMATSASIFTPVNDYAWRDILRDDMSRSPRCLGPGSWSLPSTSALKAEHRIPGAPTPSQETSPGRVSMPIETGPRSLYRNICSDDDPPRSVVICPQRRCVAFGSSSEIELHWTDGLTGENLTRRFPLATPSDFLFFLPPRWSNDSPKKLRLISSAKIPRKQSVAIEKVFGNSPENGLPGEKVRNGPDHHRHSRSANDSRDLSRFREANEFANRLTNSSDHYRAIPLSDGYHLLFTDPATGVLCLGMDGPVGGPIRLSRRIWLQGPESNGTPIAYASGRDLRWGVRVAAAFGFGDEQSIWFFSVPFDVFSADQHSGLSSSRFWPSSSFTSDPQNWESLDWWSDDKLHDWPNQDKDTVHGARSWDAWPLKIRGQEVGRCRDVVDLAVDSGPHMTIWAFSKAGIAKAWKINNGKLEKPKIQLIVRDGSVREVDDGGDVEMSDAPSSLEHFETSQSLLRAEAFDSASFSTSTVVPSRTRHYRAKHCVRYNTTGDVAMSGLDGSVEVMSQRPFGNFASAGAGDHGRIWHQPKSS